MSRVEKENTYVMEYFYCPTTSLWTIALLLHWRDANMYNKCTIYFLDEKFFIKFPPQGYAHTPSKTYDFIKSETVRFVGSSEIQPHPTSPPSPTISSPTFSHLLPLPHEIIYIITIGAFFSSPSHSLFVT